MDGGASSSQTEMNQLINCARQTKSVGTFEKIAFPELSVFDATDYGTERSLLLPSTELMRYFWLLSVLCRFRKDVLYLIPFKLN